MRSELIISGSCIGCGACVKVCIRGHLAVGEDRRAREIDSPYYCFRCGHCESVCPKNAITLRGFEDEVQTPTLTPPVQASSLADLYRFRRSQRWFDRSCNEEEIRSLISSVRYAPSAENSQAVEFAVIQERFDDFMRHCADILREGGHDHPRIGQFIDYVDGGMEGKNNPFTWEGRQIVIAFSKVSTDAVIAMEELDLMATAMGLGGFHSRWILLASEDDPERFMSFFPEISEGLMAYAVFIIGHPRQKYRRTVPRNERRLVMM